MHEAPGTLSGPQIKPASRGPAKQLVIILHGWGADGANLIDLGHALAPILPDAFFIAPNGPAVCDMGFGYQWFSLNIRSPSVMEAGAKQAAPAVNAFIDAQLAAHGLAEGNLALMGFSQGTMMSLYAALRREKPCACVVGFSGALVGAESLAGEIKSKPPVCLIHGDHDEVVPYPAMAHAAQGLQARGVPVETHARPFLGHGIDPGGLQIAAAFLKKYLVK